VMSTTRETVKIPLPSATIGTQNHLLFHKFGPKDSLEKVYIQTSIHADELPGLLVVHHLLKLLDIADKKGLIAKRIVICPFANPVGLSQIFLGSHMGRFNLGSGVNFNRGYTEVSEAVAKRVKDKLSETDANENVRIIRDAIKAELEGNTMSESGTRPHEDVMKRILQREACDADIVLDLHCDTDAVMHMYTHDKLWPALADLAAFLGSQCQIIDSDSGGKCFDEAASNPWAYLQEKFPNCSIPMACQSATVELRGELDVSDELAQQDAINLYHFLQGRGYILTRVHHHLEAAPEPPVGSPGRQGLTLTSPYHDAPAATPAAAAPATPLSPTPTTTTASTVTTSQKSSTAGDKAAAAAAAGVTSPLRKKLNEVGGDLMLAQLPSPCTRMPAVRRQPTPLTGVDMIKAEVPGVITWKVKVGQEVQEGEILGEIVNIEEPFASRTLILSHTSGIVFGKRHHHLAVPGDIIIKVAGSKPLPWRTGSLLTSK